MEIDSRCEYRVAIALNNMAISLLERRCYREALGALRSAISLIQSALLSSKDSSKNLSAEEVYGPLHAASLCLAQASVLTNPKCIETDAHFDLSVVTDSMRLDSLEMAINKFSTYSGISVVAIDAYDGDDTNVQITFITILYNYGAAHRCYGLSKLSHHHSKFPTNSCNKNAYKLIKRAHNVITRRLDEFEEDMEGDEVMWSKLMLLSMLSLQNMMYLSLKKPKNARVYYTRLGDLRMKLRNQDEAAFGSMQHYQAAAAA